MTYEHPKINNYLKSNIHSLSVHSNPHWYTGITCGYGWCECQVFADVVSNKFKKVY